MKKLIAVFVLCSSTISLSYYFFFLALPVRTGELNLPGLNSKVTVAYDKNGIPHIKANDDLDAFRSLGYVVAQHRLFQLDLQRRIATGRLSEILGEKVIELDKLNRSLGFNHYAKKFVRQGNWSKEADERIEAYLEGLNHFVENGRLPVEFKILRYKPDTFSKSDILAFIGYMSFTFQEAFKQDPPLINLLSQVDLELQKDLETVYDEIAPAIDKTKSIDSVGKLDSILPTAQIKYSEALNKALNQNDQWGFELSGSNAWIVGPEKSESNKVLIANDPHIAHSNPSVWFEASIETPKKQFHGHFLSFIPFAPMAWTPRLAWTLTMSELDDMDFYILNKDKLGGYSKANGEPIFVEKITEDILVKGGGVEKFETYVTPYGPILDKYISLGEKVSVSGFWSFYSPENQAFEGLYSMYKSEDLESFRKSFDYLTAPGLSISYGDAKGNIAWFTMGRTLVRKKFQSHTNFRFAANEEIPSLVPFSENPHLVNPADSYIVNANHRITNAHLNRFPGYYQPSDRANRIERLINSKDKANKEYFRKMLMDNQDWYYPNAKESILRSIKLSGISLPPKTLSELDNEELFANTTSLGFSFYRAWGRVMAHLMFADEMGEETYNKLFKTPVRYNLFKKILLKENSKWWDLKSTKDKLETKDDILRLAGQRTYDFLKKRMGENPELWTWGNLHKFEASHPLGRVKPLNLIFNLKPVPMAGGYSLVNAQGARKTWDNFNVSSGPSTRRIIDFAHPTWSLGILPTGNSGHRFDKFHKNQLQDYLDGRLQIRKLSYQNLTQKEIDSVVEFVP